MVTCLVYDCGLRACLPEADCSEFGEANVLVSLQYIRAATSIIQALIGNLESSMQAPGSFQLFDV